MDERARKEVLNGLIIFKPVIEFISRDSAVDVLMDALNSYPKMIYYLQSYSISSFGNRHKMTLKYRNTEIPRRDIVVIDTVEEGELKLCERIAEYDEHVVIVTKNLPEFAEISGGFMAKYSTFYPNLRHISSSWWRFDDGAYTVHEYKMTYRIKTESLDKMEAAVDAEVDRLCKLLFLDGMPDEAKIYLAHNYLATTVTYENKGADATERACTQSAYGALIQHHCVCQGFAEAFKRMMDVACIGCDVILGKIIGSDGYHAWNLVKVREDEYAHVDVTWDISSGRAQYDYFCKPDSIFSGKREWDRSLTYKCNSLYDVKRVARRYLYFHKSELLARGVSVKILDC